MMDRGATDIDRGWAWVILCATFCGMLIYGMIVFSTGVVMAAMLDEIDPDLTRSSWVSSIFAASTSLPGPVFGQITNKYGCRVSAILGGVFLLCGMLGAFLSREIYTLILTYGILSGVGIGLSFNAILVAVCHYFQKYRPIASGITVSGSGIGMFAGPPVLRILIDTYNLRGTFLIVGAFGANYCVLGMLMRPSPTERENWRVSSATSTPKRPPEKSSQYTENVARNCFIKCKTKTIDLCSVVHNLPFVCYLVSIFTWTAGESAAVLHLVNYAQRQGTSKMASASLFTAMGAGSLVSRLLTGFAASDPRIGPEILHMGLLGMLGILTVTFPLYSHEFGTQMAFAGAYGLYQGGLNTLVNPLTVELVGLKKLGGGFGLLSFAAGIGLLIGTPVAGMIVDNGGTYTHSYIYAGVLLLFACFISAPVSLRKKTQDNEIPAVKADNTEIVIHTELEPLRSRDVDVI